MTWGRVGGAALAAALVLLEVGSAHAHPLQFGALHLRERPDGTVDASFGLSDPQATPAPLSPELPAHCTPRRPPPLPDAGGTQRWTSDCGPQGLSGGIVRARGLPARRGQLLVHIERAETTHRQLLDASRPRFAVPDEPARSGVFGEYLHLGLRHILEGIDHLLFVLGLVLLVGLRWRLAAAVTAFTVGHSITLALATLGVVRFASAPIEAVIALSIALLAVELLRRRDGRASWVARRPWLAAAGFGLLHGFGFAGALSSAGLPSGAVPHALLAFNLGVEAGQLAFVGVVAALWLLLARFASRWRPALAGARLVPYAMGTVAMFWSIERVVAFWS